MTLSQTVQSTGSICRFVQKVCVLGATVFFLGVSPLVLAITYPYVLPDEVTASLDVNMQIKTPLSHMLLSVNDGGRSYYGFNSAESKDQVRSYQPLSIRWPTGVWSNFYDWEVDGRRIYDSYTDTYYDAVVNHPNLRYGFPGFHELHDELGFDVLWTWNINYDSVQKGLDRYHDRLAKGFTFKWIELGNESFWVNQRSDIIRYPDMYLTVARDHALALKAEDPNILLSIPVVWRNDGLQTLFGDTRPWNLVMGDDQSFYDAITVHKYFRPGASTDGAEEVLSLRQELLKTASDMHALFPGKPIWLSEWSVDCGDNAISVLGMVDYWLTVFNNTDSFTMSQYHQASGNMEPFFKYNDSSGVFTKTSYGAGYEIVRSVFENTEMYDSTEISTEIAPGLKGVYAEAVIKDGEIKVFALNRTTKSVPFTIKFNGVEYAGVADHEALAFDNVNAFYNYGLEEDVLTTIASGTASIVLPPLSLNVISGLTIDPGGPWDPYFYSNPLVKSPGKAGTEYSDTLADSANDSDPNETLMFSRVDVDGPDWLDVAGDGTLSGTPSDLDIGQNSFTVRVTDSTDRTDDTTLLIDVSIDVIVQAGFVENFEGAEMPAGAQVDGLTSAGVLGGHWDSNGENPYNQIRSGKTVTLDGNKLLFMEDKSNQSRQLCVTNLTDPIDDDEAGVLFFRFQTGLHATRQDIKLHAGIHAFAAGDEPLADVAGPGNRADLVAGFYAEGNRDGFHIKTIDGTTTLTTALLDATAWYDVWIVADNGTDTFDLYVSATTTAAGSEPGLPSGPALATLPFNTATTAPLTGGLWVSDMDASGYYENYYFDDIWWDGGPNPDFLEPVGVGLEDFAHLASYWLRSDCSFADNGNCYGTDLNNSGQVDIQDLEIFVGRWLEDPMTAGQ